MSNQPILQTLASLRDRYDKYPIILAQQYGGYLHSTSCYFHEPATATQIADFEREFACELPEDYKQFLLNTDGAELYDIADDGRFYPLRYVIASPYREYAPEGLFIVVEYINDHIIIDTNRSAKGESPALIIKDDCAPYEDEDDYYPLSFTEFFDYFIITQGAKFWTWPHYLVHTYYQTHDEPFPFIHKTLTSLQHRYSESPTIFCQREHGLLVETTCPFNPPATSQELDTFTQETGYALPLDVQGFYQFTDGLQLFVDTKTGECCELFSLHEMQTQRAETSDFPDGWYPIGSYADEWIILDLDAYQQGAKDYLLTAPKNAVHPDQAWHSQLNFEIWLDRLVVSQGAKYWHWAFYRER